MRTDPAAGVGTVVRHRHLRALVLANLGFKTAEMGVWIAVTVEAHQRGGVSLAGLVLVAQLLPASFVAAGTGRIAARFGAVRTATASLFAQCGATVGLAVVVATDGPTAALVAAAVVGTICVVATRPAHATALSTLSDDPRLLTATHVVLGWSDNLGTLIGPAITAAALAADAASAAFVVFACALALGGLASSRLPRQGHAPERAEHGRGDAETAATRRGIVGALGVLGVHAFVIGSLDLLVVVVAVDVVHAPEALAGWLVTALGVGGLLGAIAATALIGRRAVWPAIVPNAAVGAALLVVGGHAHTDVTALGVFVAIGGAIGFLGVTARCALQRLASTDTVSHVFALAETADTAMLLVAALAVPGLVHLTGPQHAPAVVAAMLAAVCMAAAPLVRAAERTIDLRERLRRLAACDLFAGLDAAALATLARNATDRAFAPGTVFVREGDRGDCFHLIVEGTVEVSQSGVVVVERGPGEGVGEAALLTDAPRNATLRAATTLRTLEIEREPFLLALGVFGDLRFADL